MGIGLSEEHEALRESVAGWTQRNDTLVQYVVNGAKTKWGINSGDTLAMTVNHGLAFEDFLDLFGEWDEEGFRIAMRIEGIGRGGSQCIWGITDNPGRAVPLPSAAALTLAGLGCVILRRTR